MKFKKGNHSFSEIVNILGNKQQKKSYEKNKSLGTKARIYLLEKLSRYCDYSMSDDGRAITINRTYKNPKPVHLPKLQTGLYQYMSPIILLELLHSSDENNKINLPIFKWARLIDMVNENYQPVKFNKDKVCKYFNINDNTMNEFFDKVDESMRYYMHSCLEYLRKCDVIKWYKVPMLYKRVMFRGSNDSDGQANLVCTYEHVRATDEEVKFVLDCMEYVRKELNIKTESACYYGTSSKKFKTRLKEMLKQRDILYQYDSYEVFYTNKIRVENLLKEFPVNDKDGLVKGFNQEFIDLIIKNAEKRSVKNFANEVLKEYRQSYNYLEDIMHLSELTIPFDKNVDVYKSLKLKKDYDKNFEEKKEDDFFINKIIK